MRYLFTIPAIAILASCAAPTAAGAITLAKYNQLAAGMTYEEAAAILGPGVESSRTESGGHVSVMYSWKNPDGSNMIALFSDGKLSSKSQFGLK